MKLSPAQPERGRAKGKSTPHPIQLSGDHLQVESRVIEQLAYAIYLIRMAAYLGKGCTFQLAIFSQGFVHIYLSEADILHE